MVLPAAGHGGECFGVDWWRVAGDDEAFVDIVSFVTGKVSEAGSGVDVARLVFVAEEFGDVAACGNVVDAREEHSGSVVADDAVSLGPVGGVDLAFRLPDGDELHVVAGDRRGPARELDERLVGGLVEQEHTPVSRGRFAS